MLFRSNANNFVAPIIVNSNSSKNNSKYIGVSHEYVLVYAKDISLLEGGWRVRKNNVDEFSKRAKQLVSRGLDPEEVHKELLELVKYPRFYDFDHYTYADDGGVFRVDNPGGVKNGNQKTVLTHLKLRQRIARWYFPAYPGSGFIAWRSNG